MERRISRQTIVVPYNGHSTIKRMFETGTLDRRSRLLTDDNFPSEKTDEERIEAALVPFYLNDDGISTDEVLATLQSYRLRPMTLAELLALAMQRPVIMGEVPVAALGQFYPSRLKMPRWPILSRNNAVLLSLGIGRGWGSCWRGNWHFAAAQPT